MVSVVLEIYNYFHKKQIRFILNILHCENIALNVTSTYLNDSNNHEHYRTKCDVRYLVKTMRNPVGIPQVMNY